MRAFNLRTLSGGVAWIAAALFLPLKSAQDEITLLLLFGILVMLPLGIELGRQPGRESNIYSTARYLQPFAALVTAISFLIPSGVLAGTLAIAWIPLTGLLAVDALNRLRRRRFGALEEGVIDLGTLYLPFGAAWLWASRMGLTPFGYSEPVNLLIAVHLHFAGYGGPLLAGLTGRRLRARDGLLSTGFGIAAVLIVIGPGLVSLGFSFSPAIEFSGVALLAAGYAWLSLILVLNIRPTLDNAIARLLISVSALVILLSMSLAVLYALGNASRLFYIPIPQMARTHGWLNALGFVMLGLLGWAFEGSKKVSALE